MRAIIALLLLTAVTGVTSAARAAGEVYVQVGEFGELGSGEGQFDYPYDVAIHENRVYVADSHNNRVQVFDLDGAYLFQWGGTGVEDGQFRRNRGIGATPFTGPDAAIFVTDAKNDRVQKFTLEGAHLASWGSIGDGLEEFFRPRPVEIASNGVIFVGDMDNHRVKIYSPDLQVLRIFGERGDGPGQFGAPHDFAVQGSRLYVVDHLNSRVQILTRQGAYLGEFGGAGPPEDPLRDGHFVWPMGLTMDPEGNLFVTDTDHPDDTLDRVQKFTPEGEWLASFGRHGSGVGELSRPTGIASDAQGRLYVTDSENARVTIWARRSVPTASQSLSSLKARFGG